MGTEETLQGFRPEPFVAALGQILDQDDQPQMVWTRATRPFCVGVIFASISPRNFPPFFKAILACRTLTNMLEAIPNSASAVARTASSLCAKVSLDSSRGMYLTLSFMGVSSRRAALKGRHENNHSR
jgi:hypothetical protein